MDCLGPVSGGLLGGGEDARPQNLQTLHAAARARGPIAQRRPRSAHLDKRVLLARGAARVTAIDVGKDQLDQSLAGDPRLDYRDGVNARDIGGLGLPVPDLIVCDLSFISLTKALGPALGMAAGGADLVALVKPQFELEPGDIGKGGVVREPGLRARAINRVETFLSDVGWRVMARSESPITGADGNVEFLIHGRRRDD